MSGKCEQHLTDRRRISVYISVLLSDFPFFCACQKKIEGIERYFCPLDVAHSSASVFPFYDYKLYDLEVRDRDNVHGAEGGLPGTGSSHSPRAKLSADIRRFRN